MAEVALAIAELDYLKPKYQSTALLSERPDLVLKIKQIIVKTPKTQEFKDYVIKKYPEYQDLLKYNLEDVNKTKEVIEKIDAIQISEANMHLNIIDKRIRGLICTAETTELLIKYITQFYPAYVQFLNYIV